MFLYTGNRSGYHYTHTLLPVQKYSSRLLLCYESTTRTLPQWSINYYTAAPVVWFFTKVAEGGTSAGGAPIHDALLGFIFSSLLRDGISW